MIEDGDFSRAEACYPPQTISIAYQIYEAIAKYADISSKFIDTNFIGIDRLHLAETAEKLHNINLLRYDKYISLFELKLKEEYKKSKKSGT